jgi:hypothetical protein
MEQTDSRRVLSFRMVHFRTQKSIREDENITKFIQPRVATQIPESPIAKSSLIEVKQ